VLADLNPGPPHPENWHHALLGCDILGKCFTPLTNEPYTILDVPLELEPDWTERDNGVLAGKKPGDTTKHQ